MAEPKTNLWTAIVAARKAILPITKGGKNTFHNYTYAKFEDYVHACESALTDAGLHIVTTIDAVTDWTLKTQSQKETRFVRVNGTMAVYHTCGESYAVKITGDGADVMPGDKAIYKAISGMRKYGLQCLLNLASTDDPEADSPVDKAHAETPKQNNGGTAKRPTDPAATGNGAESPVVEPLPPTGERVMMIESVRCAGQGVNIKTQKPWTRWEIVADGYTFSTFSESQMKCAERFMTSKTPAEFHWVTNAKGYVELKDILEPAVSAGVTPPVHTSGAVIVEIKAVESNGLPTWWLKTSEGNRLFTPKVAFAEIAEKAQASGEAVDIYWHAREIRGQQVGEIVLLTAKPPASDEPPPVDENGVPFQ